MNSLKTRKIFVEHFEKRFLCSESFFLFCSNQDEFVRIFPSNQWWISFHVHKIFWKNLADWVSIFQAFKQTKTKVLKIGILLVILISFHQDKKIPFFFNSSSLLWKVLLENFSFPFHFRNSSFTLFSEFFSWSHSKFLSKKKFKDQIFFLLFFKYFSIKKKSPPSHLPYLKPSKNTEAKIFNHLEPKRYVLGSFPFNQQQFSF